MFINNVFTLSDYLNTIECESFYVYLPSSYHLIEFIFASIIAEKNINYLSKYKLQELNKITENFMLFTYSSYESVISTIVQNQNTQIININPTMIYFKNYNGLLEKYETIIKSKLQFTNTHYFWTIDKKHEFNCSNLFENIHQIDFTNSNSVLIQDNLLNTFSGINYTIIALLNGCEILFEKEVIHDKLVLITSDKDNVQNGYHSIHYLSNNNSNNSNHKNENSDNKITDLNKNKILFNKDVYDFDYNSLPKDLKDFSISVLRLPYHFLVKNDFILFKAIKNIS